MCKTCIYTVYIWSNIYVSFYFHWSNFISGLFVLIKTKTKWLFVQFQIYRCFLFMSIHQCRCSPNDHRFVDSSVTADEWRVFLVIYLHVWRQILLTLDCWRPLMESSSLLTFHCPLYDNESLCWCRIDLWPVYECPSNGFDWYWIQMENKKGETSGSSGQRPSIIINSYLAWTANVYWWVKGHSLFVLRSDQRSFVWTWILQTNYKLEFTAVTSFGLNDIGLNLQCFNYRWSNTWNCVPT